MTQNVSNASLFFRELAEQADPFAWLAGIPDRKEPFFEEEWIDFKGQPADEKDAKKTWSKALSGYANLGDGLIVWGIDARKKAPRDIDAASGLNPIISPKAFESNLREWIRDATNPPVIGVDYKSIEGPDGPGFVVCLVPESTHKPHRAEWAGRQYYYRAGDDFLAAEPAMLKRLFYPQHSAQIAIDWCLEFKSEVGRHSTNGWLSLKIDVVNEGNASAYDVFIRAEHGTLDVVAGAATPSPWLAHASGWTTVDNGRNPIAVMSQVPLHPSVGLRCLNSYRWPVRMEYVNPSVAAGQLRPRFKPLILTLDVYVRDGPHQHHEVSFHQDEFARENTCTKRAEIVSA
jgi:Putative DNA-binding domain